MIKRLKKSSLAFALSLACLGMATPIDSALAETQFYSTRSHLPDLKFELQHTDEQRLSEQQFKQKVVLVYFGYTYCPDVCPTTMAELALMKSMLSEQQQAQVQVIFISVDPHRDTPARLEKYLEAFGLGAIGLSGTEKEIAAIAKRYRVAYQIEKPKNPNNPELYDVMHAEGIYVFDTNGKAAFLASNSHDIEGLHQRVVALLK
ncbi:MULTISPECIES: SCO family protein [Oligella]|uniref:Electron transporter n=2 Tax=Oligella urethralis TaxID=90245 RepID=A0A095ZCL1_9BURK|nr:MULTISPECIES: SCO family protein [Oligella]AVL71015.1 SCO family protein [Oligella urethralis]KGF32490.1 electron transporter [Oligella urethralis DNF00040]OFS84666.1 electron transporter [Oligella sp. HMSC05A10]OFV47888.1 electron transporter [Oligella sp. HMSC09E12]PMC17874.1 SCO family protein [Oligella urethralis]